MDAVILSKCYILEIEQVNFILLRLMLKILKHFVIEIKNFKFQIMLQVTFPKEIKNYRAKYLPPIFSNPKTQADVNDLDINGLKVFYHTVLSRLQKWLGEGSGWINESIDVEYINISIYNPLVGRSYIQLPEELRNSRKGPINIQNKDNEFFRGFLIRQLILINKEAQRVRKPDKEMVLSLDYKDIKFPVSKKVIIKLRRKTTLILTYFDMKISTRIQFIDKGENLKITWNYC